MHKIGKIFGCCLIAVTLLACTACSGLDKLSENLKDGATQLSDDVVIGKSNALITPYHRLASHEGKRYGRLCLRRPQAKNRGFPTLKRTLVFGIEKGRLLSKQPPRRGV